MMKESYFEGVAFKGWDCIPRYSKEKDIVQPNYYTLQFNQSGFIEYMFNDSDLPRTVSGSYAWVTHPQTRYQYRSPRGTSRYHRYISFSGPRCRDFVKKGLIPPRNPSPMIQITKTTEFIAAFDALQKSMSPNLGPIQTERYESGTIFQDAEIINPHYSTYLLEGLLLLLHNQPEENPAGIWTRAIRDLLERVQEHPEAEWNFGGEAGKLSLSITHFRRLFLKCAGQSPERYLRTIRIEKAAQLLRETHQSVALVAEAVGLEDISHFSKVFKKHYHLSPLNYRKEMAMF